MVKNKLHVLGLAHLPTVAKDPIFACAYSQKILRFCDMMTNIGYDVIFYGVEGSNVNCAENVVVLSEDDRNRIYGPLDQFASKFFQHGKNDPAYKIFIENAIREILDRVEKNDVVCNPMGNYYEDICRPKSQGGVEIANGYPWLVESGIGYDGILMNTHRVFESNAWRHYVYGIYKAWTQSKRFVNGDFYDTVIPNFYFPEHYKFREEKEDFFFMNCRIANRKGIDIAIKTCEATGDHLILAGQPGENVDLSSPNVQYIGYVDEKTKLELLSRAKGLFSPTLYIGPFEGVTVEALMCLPGNTEITFPEISEIHLNEFTGSLYEIETETGKIIQATPEHPILTQRGWIPVKYICINDIVYNYRSSANDREVESRRIGDVCETLSQWIDERSMSRIQSNVGRYSDESVEDGVTTKSSDYNPNAGNRYASIKTGIFGGDYRRRRNANIKNTPSSIPQKFVLHPTNNDIQYVETVDDLDFRKCELEKHISLPTNESRGESSTIRIWSKRIRNTGNFRSTGTSISNKKRTLPDIDSLDKQQTFAAYEGISHVIRRKRTVGKIKEIESEIVTKIRIRDVTRLKVYNLTTLNNFYMAGGIIVHNCGTPVITTDFGCYTETIPKTVGVRCMVLKEFVKAAKHIDTINPRSCRSWAVEQFSTSACAWKYDTYFKRLTDLWGQGWGELGTVIP